MIPIYGFLEGDTMGLLILAYPNETVQELINKVQKAAAIRVTPRSDMKLIYKDQSVDFDITVSEMGVQPLEHFFVIQGDAASC